MDFAAREGWNPGLHDGAAFHAADPEAFFVAEAGGEPVGCISAVRYGSDFGFIGLYIVAPAWRGQGIGMRLWAAGMARLAGRVVGLDGVPAQQPNYRRSGFVLAWQNLRFAGVAKHVPDPSPPQIVPLGKVDFAAMVASDRRVFPAPREAFLRSWIGMPQATSLGWVEQGRLAGWGTVRRCREGHKIGPLVADSPHIAAGLYAALCNSVPAGEAVVLDVPLPNTDAVALARAHGLLGVFETARMFTATAPACEMSRVYGITSFELG